MPSDLAWPSLEWNDWKDTADTLHMWTQIVGHTRLALCAPQNHWWHVTLYVSARGLTTAPIPCPSSTDCFEVEFDFIAHQLVIRHSAGAVKVLPLRAQSSRRFIGNTWMRWQRWASTSPSTPFPMRLPIRFRLRKTRYMRATMLTRPTGSGGS